MTRSELGIKPENLFNPLPEEFDPSKKAKNCVVVVHPGYNANYKVPFTDNPQNETEQNVYGSYVEYWNNLTSLVAHLEGSDDVSIFAVENQVYTGELIPNLRQPASSLTIVTETRKGSPLESVETPDGTKEQNMGLFVHILQTMGVTDIRFAGEYAWKNSYVEFAFLEGSDFYRENVLEDGETPLEYDPNEDSAACLETLAHILRESGFNVQGIEGCIYPLKPTNLGMAAVRDLYVDQVKIPSNLQRLRGGIRKIFN